MKNNIENYEELASKLLGLYNQIENKEIELKHAKGLQVTASTVVSLYKTKVLYNKTEGIKEKIDFLETK
jgi:hypothetical protein